MANIQERRDKSGKLVSYSIRVHRGRGMDGKQLKPWTATFEVSPTWTEKSARKKAEAFAATFEKECREGVTSDSRQKFAAYCDYVIGLKEQRGVKHSTIVRYKELTGRIYPQIGHIKLRELRADHLNDLYTQLAKPGAGKGSSRATAKVDLVALLKEKKLTRSELSQRAGIPLRAVYSAVKGEQVSKETAEAISNTLGVNAFKVEEESTRTLSAKTILEHHRLISTVLEQAVKEGLVPFNVAGRATLPKAEHKEVNYFQPEQVAAIREALEQEPMKWKMLVHLFLITGARRGELLGLKWDKVDFEGNRIYICNSILYAPDIGIYESTPKTERSRRYITLPVETMQLLRRYRAWHAAEWLGECYQNQGSLLFQDNRDQCTRTASQTWLKKFSMRHGLTDIQCPRFSTHSGLYALLKWYGWLSFSKRLRHSQVSTTANTYAHVTGEARPAQYGYLSEAFLKKTEF